MYIVAIAWLYVTILMAVAESNWVAGVLTLVFYGLFPVSLLLWLFGGPVRRRARQAETETTTPPSTLSDQPAGERNRQDAKPDQ